MRAEREVVVRRMVSLRWVIADESWPGFAFGDGGERGWFFWLLALAFMGCCCCWLWGWLCDGGSGLAVVMKNGTSKESGVAVEDAVRPRK